MKHLTELEVEGTKYKFDFGMSGWRRVEALAGKPMQECLKEIQSAAMLCLIVQGTLQRFHPDITLDEAGDIATVAGEELSKVIQESYGLEDAGDAARPMQSLKVAS